MTHSILKVFGDTETLCACVELLEDSAEYSAKIDRHGFLVLPLCDPFDLSDHQALKHKLIQLSDFLDYIRTSAEQAKVEIIFSSDDENREEYEFGPDFLQLLVKNNLYLRLHRVTH